MFALAPVETKILNVNDDAASRYLWKRILRDAGYQVREAETGHAALCEVRTDRPDLVLLDVKLPDVDGFSVCRQIKNLDSSVPILMASAWFTSENDFVNGLTTGADGYLYEPADSRKLLAMVKTILRMSARLRQSQTREKELERQNSDLRDCIDKLRSAQEELKEHLADSRRFEEAVIGRELKLIEYEKKIQRLQAELQQLKSRHGS